MRRIKHGFISTIGGKATEMVDQFTVSAADFAALNTAPVSLVAAHGLNKALIVTAMLFQFKFGTVEFTLGGAVNPVYHGTTTNPLSGSVAAATIQGNANAIVALDAAGGPLTAPLNTGLDLYAATANFAGGGDSTAIVTLWYTVYEIG